MRYTQLRDIIDEIKPKTIIEIGTHSGARAVLMCMQALRYNTEVHYIGYDLFEQATPDTNKAEMNGKGAGNAFEANGRLEGLRRMHPGLSWKLVKGNTRETLHGKNVVADFVFIDGGHSIATIKGDYEAVKGSKVVVFDDYYTGVDTSKYGCNALMDTIPHRVLPDTDQIGGGATVQMAVRP